MDRSLDGSRFLQHLGCTFGRMTWDSSESSSVLAQTSPEGLYETEPCVGLARGGGFGPRQRLPATPYLGPQGSDTFIFN